MPGTWKTYDLGQPLFFSSLPSSSVSTLFSSELPWAEWWPVAKETWQFLRKLNINLPHDWEVPLPVYPKEMNTYVHISSCTQRLIAAWFMVVKKQKQHKGLSTGWTAQYIRPWNITERRGIPWSTTQHVLLTHVATWMNLKNKHVEGEKPCTKKYVLRDYFYKILKILHQSVVFLCGCCFGQDVGELGGQHALRADEHATILWQWLYGSVRIKTHQVVYFK